MDGMKTAVARGSREKKLYKSHLGILRLQGLDALGDIAIIDVAAVDVHEVLQSGRLVVRRFVGGRPVRRCSAVRVSSSMSGNFRALSYQRIAASGTPLSRKHWASQV